MANGCGKIKDGMKGSNGGRSRWTKTEILKRNSKKPRRRLGKKEIATQLKEVAK